MAHRTLTWQNSSGRTIYSQSWHPDSDRNSDRSTNAKNILVLIPGLGDHSGRYSAWAERFVAQGVAVYSLDTHGHGQTSGRRGHTESFQLIYDDIKHLLAAARKDYPQARMHLYGHSMGAALSLGYVTLRGADLAEIKLTSLICTGTIVRPGFEPAPWKIMLATHLDSLVPGLALGNELDPNWISSNASIVSAYKQDPLVHDRITVRWYNEWMRTIAAVKAHVGPLLVPVFMLHGAADKAASPAAARDLAVGLTAKFQMFEGAYHELHFEACQGEVFSSVLSWIKGE